MLQPRIQFTLCPLASCILFLQVSLADNWTQFRGPGGQGKSSEINLPLKWSMTENIAWKTPIPGNAWSSPIVYEERIFLTSAEEEGKSCRVICVNRADGTIAWNKEVHRQTPTRMREQNSYATPTPVTDGRQVYAVFFDGTAVAVDFNGNLVWKNSDFKFYSLHGLGASPALAQGKLIMPFDGSSREEERVGWKTPWQEAAILAWDTTTGKVLWTGRRGDSRVGHVTPILVDNENQLISAGGDKVQGFDVRTGQQIWSVFSQGEGVTPTPVIGDGMIFTSSGFEEPTIRAIRLGGRGNITNTHIVWEQKKGVPVLASPLLVSPYLYTISRDNILFCIEEATGEVVWQERLSGAHSASPIYAEGRIYVLSEEGVTLVLRPGNKYDEIARNSVDGVCKATMVVSQGHFYIRSSTNLYCIGAK